ncbi:hypothetical protein ABK040_008078 [Willaertia magna]
MLEQIISQIVYTTNSTILSNSTVYDGANGGIDFLSIIRSTYVTAITSGLFASIISILLTITIEKLGGRLGGIISSIPTAIVPTTIGFYLDAQRQYATDFNLKAHVLTQELYTVPISNFISTIFLLCWKVIPYLLDKLSERESVKESKLYKYWKGLSETKRKVMKALTVCLIALFVWFCFGCSWLILQQLVVIPDIVLICVSVGVTMISLLLAITVCWNTKELKEAPKKKTKGFIILLRALLPFVFISTCVLLAHQEQFRVVAGLLAGFPTIFTTTLLTLWIGQEEAVTLNVVGPMMLGSTSVSVFTCLACPTILHWNLFAGLAFSYDIAVICINVPSYFFLRWRSAVCGTVAMSATNVMESPKEVVLLEEGVNNEKIHSCEFITSPMIEISSVNVIQLEEEKTCEEMQITITTDEEVLTSLSIMDSRDKRSYGFDLRPTPSPSACISPSTNLIMPSPTLSRNKKHLFMEDIACDSPQM